MAVKKLFTWAMMLRVDMHTLSDKSIDLYAIGEEKAYTNTKPVISLITTARRHTEISAMTLDLKRTDNKARAEKWQQLYNALRQLNGYKQDDTGA